MTISLAFLAPNLVKAAVEGRLPHGIGVERLRDPPTEWRKQFEVAPVRAATSVFCNNGRRLNHELVKPRYKS
jgi:hypothetical protein